jgi:hypothetical protein
MNGFASSPPIFSSTLSRRSLTSFLNLFVPATSLSLPSFYPLLYAFDMRTMKSPLFNSDEAKILYESKITDLQTLRERPSSSVLVAFDTKGVPQKLEGRLIGSDDIGELGVAFSLPSEGSLRLLCNLTQFYDDNIMKAFTVVIRDRSYGPAVGMMTERTPAEAGARLHEFLSPYEGDRILIGFGMRFRVRMDLSPVPIFCRSIHIVVRRSKVSWPAIHTAFTSA